MQYTIRNIPKRLDLRIRGQAEQQGVSLNKAALEVLARGVDMDPAAEHHDLDDLAGTWIDDPAFDEAVAEMDRVDEELWR